MPRLRRPLAALAAPALLLLPALLLFVSLAGAPLAHAQTAPSPDAPPVSTVPDAPEEEQPAATTLRVNVNLVSLFFTVRDKHNGLVSTLTKKDCSILEDKQPQTIKNFSTETDLPLTLGILIDTSGSQERVLPLEQQSADTFIRDVIGKKDEAFVVSFDVGVNLEQ